MKTDSGASTNLINYNTFNKLLGNASKLTSTSSRIHINTAEVVTRMGEVEWEFTYNNQKVGFICYNHEG